VLIAELKKFRQPNKDQSTYIEYLSLYRGALAETDRNKLDSHWLQVDRVWMDLKTKIQIVHDIEYGYGDPLRTKVIPDFSLRFVDDDYAAANQQIEGIKKVMVQYFGNRNTNLSKKGLFALENSFAAIYYLPFQSGMSLHFRFSGQSIPNSSEVRDEKGVKIYFDPVSTAARHEQVKKLLGKVFADHTVGDSLNAVEELVYHVAAHEFGHAIYGLDHVKEVIKTDTKSLLEEPRAELTTLTVMKLLYDNKQFSLAEVQKQLLGFALGGLRRFSMFENSSTRPYTISAIDTYRSYEKTGFFTLVNEKIHVHPEHTVENLTHFTRLFEQVLDAEDALDGKRIEQLLADMQSESRLTKWLVQQLSSK